jgi:RNA polymerase sigma-70 factor, ECF subfamily
MSDDCPPASEEAGRLIQDHQEMLTFFIQTIVHDAALAEEIFSDVKLAILQSWHRYDPSRPFLNWARGVARLVAYETLRAQSRQPESLPPDVIESMADQLEPITAGGQGEFREAVQGCVQNLPPHHRRLIQSRYYDDCPYKELAGLFGKSLGSLYTVFRRCHAQLRECILKKIQNL